MKSPAKISNRDCVILLHGLARTNMSMMQIARALKKAGYQTFNCNYPSRKQSIELLSETYIARAIARCRSKFQPERIHFVAHSMGGILIRYYLAQNKLENLGRVVMLAPPNAGSELVDHLSGFQLFHLINGPAGSQLGTASSNLPKSLGPVDFELGIIAGNKSINFLSSSLIPGEDDGKISIKSARLEGMADFIVLPHSHSFMMHSPRVIEQTLKFLREGRFDHSKSSINT